MKVLLLNGSRRSRGCTRTALDIVASELDAAGIDTVFMDVGLRVLNGELDESVKEALAAMKEADGLVIGSPVYYASPSGEIISFLDRLFWEGSTEFKGKPCAVLASARRAGTTASIEVLNKYPTICGMPLVSSCYWNMVHGNRPDDVLKDEEGVDIMKNLGRNMAWLLKCIEAGENAGIGFPEQERHPKTNFIR